MIPSLMAFHVIFFAFYALHSYTADKKAFDRKTIVKKLDETRKSVTKQLERSVELTRRYLKGEYQNGTENGQIVSTGINKDLRLVSF